MFNQDFSSLDLVSVLRKRVRQDPDSLLYTFLSERGNVETKVTFRDLDLKARSIAGCLVKNGHKGSRAILLYPSGLDFVTAFIGCLYANVIPVPAYPPNPSALERNLLRLQKVVRDAEAGLVLCDTQIMGLFESMKSNLDADEGNASLAAEIRDSFVSGMQWMDTAKIEDHWADTWTQPTIQMDDFAFLQYTSGSTGTPKGVIVSHGNLRANAVAAIEAFQLNEASRWACWLPLYHDMGLIGNILFAIFSGGEIVYFPPHEFLQNPVRWLQTISKYQASGSSAPNFAYDLCVRKVKEEEIDQLDLSSWVLALNAAEPIQAETMRQFTAKFSRAGFSPNAHYGAYGLAESTVFVSGGIVEEPPAFRVCDRRELQQNKVVYLPEGSPEPDVVELVGAGRAWQDQEIIVVNPKTLRRCADLEVGEIWTRGKSVPRGYWNNREATEEVFNGRLAEGGGGAYMRTGDLGFLEGDELFVSGRIKDMIIVRGRNIYPQDLEATATALHSLLRPGCSAAFSMEKDGQVEVVLVAELRKEAFEETDLDQLAASIATEIALQHGIRLHALQFLKARTIPKTSSGKIARKATKKGFLSGTLGGCWTWENPSAEMSPSDFSSLGTTEFGSDSKPLSLEDLQAFFAKSLGDFSDIPPGEVDLDSSFSSYGLDSMASVEMVEQLERMVSRQLSLTLIWDYPSPNALAAHLIEQVDPPSESKPEAEAPDDDVEDLLGQLLDGVDSPRSLDV